MPTAGQHGLVAHSDGAFVPVQTRSERFRSANVDDFEPITGREHEWKYSPVAAFADLTSGELDGSRIEVESSLREPQGDADAAGVTLSWISRDDDRIGRVNLVVAQEDINILAELDPVMTPDTNTREVLVPSDKAVVVYRDWLKKFDARGWRIDFETVKAKKGKAAMAIPSPARRTAGNWVVEPVPLLKTA